MLLAAATPASPGDRVVDFGAGVGAAGLAVARRVAGIELVLVEIDDALAGLARGNAAANAIAADVVVLDVTSAAGAFAAAGLAPDSVDVVLMNPPFNDPVRHRASPDKAREIAHVATAATLESWVHAGTANPEIRRRPHPDLARRRPGGGAGGARPRLWQPGRSCRFMATRRRRRSVCWFAPPRAERRRRESMPALMLNDESGVPNKQVQEILAGKGVLPLAIP